LQAKAFTENLLRRKPVLKEKTKGMFLVKVFTEGKKVIGKAFPSIILIFIPS
jgi:hypothetical protein